MVDEMCLTKSFTSVEVAMICKLLTENVVMGLLLSIMCGNTVQEWANMAPDDFCWIISKQCEWYPLGSHNSVPSHRIEL